MNRKILFLMITIISTIVSKTHGAQSIETKAFPDEAIRKITSYKKLSSGEIFSLESGIVHWGASSYLGALTNKAQNECRIYGFNEARGIAPLALYPDCKFIGNAELINARKKEMPDIVFKMLLSSGKVPGPVEYYIVAVFDEQKKEYCESQSIAAWYQIGILVNAREADDLECPALIGENGR